MELYNSPFQEFDYDEAGVQAFKEYFWYSSEVCNNCFSRIRSVGPTKKVQLGESGPRNLREGPPLTMEISEWYERTELGSQEHTPFDTNKRFGTCFCMDCGHDCTGNHRDKTLLELKPLAMNIVAYARDHTPLSVDAERFAREIAQLKKETAYQSWETEILAVAFSRALE